MHVTGDQIVETGVKGVHWGLRLLDQAPEQRRARSLRAQAERFPPPAPDAPRVLILTMRDWAAHVHWEAMIAHGLRQRGAQVDFLTCGGGLDICDRTCTWEAPPMPCGSCTRYTEASLTAHGFAPHDIRSSWEKLRSETRVFVTRMEALVTHGWDDDSALVNGEIVSVPTMLSHTVHDLRHHLGDAERLRNVLTS